MESVYSKAVSLFFALFIFTFIPTFSQDAIFENVNIINVENGDIIHRQYVLIKDGTISKIKKKPIKVGPDVIRIDGTDKYLSPGLSEMHAHIPIPRGKEDNSADETMKLYLAHGVTLVRGMIGHPFHLELKEKWASQEVDYPRIYSSSPSVNGNSVPDEETADRVVRQYKEDGYDFLKLHPGLKRSVFDKVVNVANEVGIKYSGHVSIDVGVRHAIKSKYASIDHIDGYLEGLVPEKRGLDPATNGFFGYNFADDADFGQMEKLARFTKANNVWVVPTHALMTRWTAENTEEIISEPQMNYVSSNVRRAWIQANSRFKESGDYSVGQSKLFVDIRDKMLKTLFDEGVGILLGSDSPQVFNVPGYSIHLEMQAMQSAGIPPHEILKSGTINVANFFDAEGKYGVIKKGASADLVLLSKNPMVDISYMQNIDGVMMRGKWMNVEWIETTLSEISQRNKGE